MVQMINYADRLIRKAEAFSSSFLHLRACPHREALLQLSDFLPSGSSGPEAWFCVEELSKNVTLKIFNPQNTHPFAEGPTKVAGSVARGVDLNWKDLEYSRMISILVYQRV